MAAMHDDPQMEAEHEAAMNLVRDSEVTHQAVRNGNWSDPATWQNGRVPAAGAIVKIPDGIEVEYDVNSNVDIFKVRIDGKLDFATGSDTLLKVDTILVTEMGELEIGTAADPIEAASTARILFADNGAVRWTSWDPQQLHRGLVSHGAVEMHGQAKEDFVKVTATPQRGQTSITLEDAPTGWRVGDKIVLTGTHLLPDDKTYISDTRVTSDEAGTEDEVLTISSISGNTVRFNEPLRFNHDAPAADLKAYVANLTRNIVISSESKVVAERGHVMLMHSDDIDVQNVQFLDLGRTDKSRSLDDRIAIPEPGSPGKYNSRPVTDLTDIDNQRGRYSLHIHRTGAEADDPAANIVGNVIWGSPGWGFSAHDAHTNLTNNVSFDVYGSHFVGETGNETGRWVENIAIKSEGRPLPGAHQPDVGKHDLGYEGNGFWLNGRIIEMQSNVAVGQSGSGFSWFGRGDLTIPTDTDALENPLTALYAHEIESFLPAVPGFRGNEVIASDIGLKFKRQGYIQSHDERSIFEDFVGWEIKNGLDLTYTSDYLFRDVRLYGADMGPQTTGIDIKKNTESMTFWDVDIHDFDEGVTIDRTLDIFQDEINTNPADRNDRQHFFIDVRFHDMPANTRFKGQFNSTFDRILSESALRSGVLRLEVFESSMFLPWNGRIGGMELEIKGRKFDSLGEVRFPPVSEHIDIPYENIQTALQDIGYSTLRDGRKVMVLEVLFSDRATAEIDTQKFMVVLDGDWRLPTGAKYLGAYEHADDVQIPDSIRPFIPDTDDPVVINGTNGDNVINGTGGADTINGLGGEDTLSGAAGNDLMDGGDGDDTMLGGDGNDKLLGGDNNDRLEGGDGDDDMTGGAGADLLQGGDGADTMRGGTNDDRLEGSEGNDKLYGAENNDDVYGWLGDDGLYGGTGNDNLFGQQGNDVIFGDDGIDRLVGDSGIDELFGGAGTDRLEGGSENDQLEGGTGNDDLVGGTGADDFVFTRGGGYDEVLDFQNGVDDLAFRGFGANFNTAQEIIAKAVQVGSDLRITLPDPGLGTSTTIYIENFQKSQFDATDFSFVIA